ncbi:MAG: septation ring formation regulator EzrA [Pelagibacteraceae bacterium]|jgi:cell division protein FtsB|nr:septation ring formation regulator EzrA [Pelagibacteraceae bacterium]|tara:strand:+ start:1639 stop:1935 length:297 start_codon:yes stop_codon:yes gene_type:complete
MGLIQIINRKKITIIGFFLFFYIILNLLDGERGLISYYEKQNIKKKLLEEKSFLTEQLALVEKKNELLTEKIDLDYLEILFREKFMFGKPNEKIYKSN